MFKFQLLSAGLFLGLTAAVPASVGAKELRDLKVLYVGSERASVYVGFLSGKVARIEARSRQDFQPRDAAPFDVVMLDWPQGEETREMRKLKSPLGRRDEWDKPTVLLGSAGLNLAVSWKMKGGSGCTCMDPMAFDLRQHRIFDTPFKIDRAKMISIPTPDDFKDEIKEPEIKVLALVSDLKTHWNAGWCTHARDFEVYPDVEFLSGGVNHQTPTSAGLWRQGNLLHFGFEQSPDEMNDVGKQLLLNSIAYISHFTEDRPITINPSVFAGPVARNRWTLRAGFAILTTEWIFARACSHRELGALYRNDRTASRWRSGRTRTPGSCTPIATRSWKSMTTSRRPACSLTGRSFSRK